MPRREQLTPELRSLRARMAAHALHKTHDGREVTAEAGAADPSSDAYWQRKVDPDLQLDPVERNRRADHAKKEHYARMAYRSAIARSSKAKARRVPPRAHDRPDATGTGLVGPVPTPQPTPDRSPLTETRCAVSVPQPSNNVPDR